MANQSREQDDMDTTAPTNLADEFRKLILELDADQADYESQRFSDIDEGPGLIPLLEGMKNDLEKVDVELIVAMRLLRQSVQASQIEFTNQILRIERKFHDEITAMEKRIRADIAELRKEL